LAGHKFGDLGFPSTTGRKIYCECHFLLTITANYCPCTVSADNYCHLLSLLLSVLRITVIYCAFYCQCCDLLSFTVLVLSVLCPCTVGTANYSQLLSLSIASREPWKLRLRLNTQGKWPLYKDFFFQNYFLYSAFSFLASRDNYNDTKHCMCICGMTGTFFL
jgi:hypothetical protein